MASELTIKDTAPDIFKIQCVTRPRVNRQTDPELTDKNVGGQTIKRNDLAVVRTQGSVLYNTTHLFSNLTEIKTVSCMHIIM